MNGRRFFSAAPSVPTVETLGEFGLQRGLDAGDLNAEAMGYSGLQRSQDAEDPKVETLG